VIVSSGTEGREMSAMVSESRPVASASGAPATVV
jgi:hypothetical protein